MIVYSIESNFVDEHVRVYQIKLAKYVTYVIIFFFTMNEKEICYYFLCNKDACDCLIIMDENVKETYICPRRHIGDLTWQL